MLRKGAQLTERDLGRDPLSEAELKKLFRGRDPREFLNSRNALYRERKMKDDPPSPTETIRLMAQEPNLIRRPLLVRGRDIVMGYDEAGFKRLLRKRG